MVAVSTDTMLLPLKPFACDRLQILHAGHPCQECFTYVDTATGICSVASFCTVTIFCTVSLFISKPSRTRLWMCSGRKKAALTYVFTYTFGCFTKHWNNFQVLLLGRVFCGIATSLLYSAFESWLVAEHFKVKPSCTVTKHLSLMRVP